VRDGFDFVFQKTSKGEMNESTEWCCTRRRMIAGAFASLLFPACRRGPEKKAPSSIDLGLYRWSGIGFGIEMSMEIHGVNREDGERMGGLCEGIIAKLEQAFSLYRSDSELSVLNRERALAKPSPIFAELVDLSAVMEQRTLSYYQPAIHGAWQWMLARGDLDGLEADAKWQDLCAASRMEFLSRESDGALRLTNPLTQLSMNAIGQGFLADQVAGELRKLGVTSALLELGETYAIGKHPVGRPWKLAVAGSVADDADAVPAEIELIDAGLAVSASDLDHLLIDPVSRQVRRHNRVVAVVSQEGAAAADAFATAFAVAPPEVWQQLASNLERGGSSRVRIWEEHKQVFDSQR
jgi:thiamine biosynthesis lipoprotein